MRRFELDLDKPARTYSTGNRQKVALVAAFATRAPLLVLDEPTSGLDPLMEREFRSCVAEARDRGQTVFLSSHQLGEVEAVCDRVGILRAGRLVEVARIAELRRLRRTEVEVSLAGPPRYWPACRACPGSSGSAPSRLRFSLSGSPTRRLRALAAADVTAPGGAGTDPGGDLPGVLRRGRRRTDPVARPGRARAVTAGTLDGSAGVAVPIPGAPDRR